MLTPQERARRTLEEAFRLSEEGRLQSAIQACQQAITLNPRSTSAHSLLGTLYERTGDRDGAIRSYEQVLTLSPGSTVERRRLNELMGVSAPPTEIGISPRTTRMAVTGGFVVVALILVGAIIFTTQQPGPQGRGPRARVGRAAQAPQPRAGAAGVAPARLVTCRTAATGLTRGGATRGPSEARCRCAREVCPR
jgi:tetratricopeptide (TPR) repeat protein